MENAIEVVGLSKRFRIHRERRTSLKERFVRGRPDDEAQYFWALRDATFSVHRGASLGLIGHNGSGKSTALKVLAGIYRPTTGHVSVNGTVSALLEVGAGFHPELTGRENIRLNATILGFTRRQIDGLMDQIIEFADIGDFIDSPVKHYSSGMYVRLGFAVAVMVRPEILIVDEVIAVGDEEFQRKCFDYLHSLRRAGTSMIIVSHGLSSITDLCDEALWLERGNTREIGPSETVTQSYINEVNAKEAARTVPGTYEDLDPGTESDPAVVRRGSGEIRFRTVGPVNEEGDALRVLISGGPAQIRIAYECQEDVPDAAFTLDIFNSKGIQVTSVTSERTAVEVGRGHIDFTTDDLLLLGGSYTVNCGVAAEGRTLDTLLDALQLTVRSAGVTSNGTYMQRGRWHLEGERT